MIFDSDEINQAWLLFYKGNRASKAIYSQLPPDTTTQTQQLPAVSG